MFRRMFPLPARWGLLLAVLALASGCATNTLTGRNQLMLVSEESAISGSASAYANMMGDYGKKKQIETGTERAAKVREITNRLIAEAVRFRPDSAKWKWEVQVINDPKTVNAFCMAGGKMGIYTGFWEKLKATDDEIANVMGHEIGHALANHTQERMSVAMGSTVAAGVLAAVLSGNQSDSFQRNMALTSMAASLAITLPNSRESETEADQIGIELAARAGYDPRGAVSLWQKMAKEGGSPPEFMSTHPAPENRMQRLDKLVAQMDPYYQAAKGRNYADAPRFVGVSVNERPVGAQSREEYAAKVAADPQTLSFVAAEFDRFRKGTATLTCTAECSVQYLRNKGTWKELHGKGAWRDLAVGVMRVNYGNDLTWFLMAEAAAGLNLNDTARIYYRNALDARTAGRTCSGTPNTCDGFDIAGRAAAMVRK